MNSDTDDWLLWNGDLDNPNYNENDGEADDEHDMDICNDSDVIDEAQQPFVHAAPDIAGFIRPVRMSNCTATLIVMNPMPVNTQQKRNGKGNK